MPSPLGHALGVLAAGWLVAGGEPAGVAGGVAEAGLPGGARRPVARAIAFAALGMAADLDLLFGRHSQFTHSVGMALGVGLVALVWLRSRGRPGAVPIAASITAAYASHILLDWLGQDATPPLGITALWPFDSAYFLSGANVFLGISREPWRPGAAWHDAVAIAREVLLIGPVALAALWLRRAPGQILPASAARSGQGLPSAGGRPADGESR